MALQQATRTRPSVAQATTLQDERLQTWAPSDTVAIPITEDLLQRDAVTRAKFYTALSLWASAIFGLVYVAGPLAMAGAGWTAAIRSMPHNLVAWAMAVPAVLAVLEWARPKVHLGRERDPVGWVVLGSLIGWVWLHNSVGVLRPFASFSTGELAAFVGLNVLEFAMIGVVLAMMARTRAQAFVLGLGSQVLYIALFVFGLALI